MLWIRRQSRAFQSFVARVPRRQRIVLCLVVASGAAFAATASADWVGNSGYLWNASAPFSLSVNSHANATWTQWLTQSAADWSRSGVVTVSVGGSGKIDFYDGSYGTGMPCAWTQYWQHGGHLSHDAVYMNETCVAGWSDYWKQYAVCQELGHALGMLDHNTTPTVPSCMAPSMAATSPSTDDFAELASLYGVGSSTTSTKGGGKGSTPLAGGMTTTTIATTTPSHGNGSADGGISGRTRNDSGNSGGDAGGSSKPLDPGQSPVHRH